MNDILTQDDLDTLSSKYGITNLDAMNDVTQYQLCQVIVQLEKRLETASG